jgi:hypothetical protein
MYQTAVVLHSLLRWAVVLLGVYSALRALSGLVGKKAWTPADLTAGRLFVIALDTQFLLGVLLYGLLSPLVTAAMTDVGAAMKTPALRYWLVEHPLPMFVALGLVHLGFARAKRTNSTLSHRQMLVHLGVALLLILASTPWPFMANARPWLRFW